MSQPASLSPAEAPFHRLHLLVALSLIPAQEGPVGAKGRTHLTDVKAETRVAIDFHGALQICCSMGVLVPRCLVITF